MPVLRSKNRRKGAKDHRKERGNSSGSIWRKRSCESTTSDAIVERKSVSIVSPP